MKDAGGEGLLLDGGADPPLPGQLLGRFRHAKACSYSRAGLKPRQILSLVKKGPSGHNQSLNVTAGIGRVIRHAFNRISHLPFLSPKGILKHIFMEKPSQSETSFWARLRTALVVLHPCPRQS